YSYAVAYTHYCNVIGYRYRLVHVQAVLDCDEVALAVLHHLTQVGFLGRHTLLTDDLEDAIRKQQQGKVRRQDQFLVKVLRLWQQSDRQAAARYRDRCCCAALVQHGQGMMPRHAVAQGPAALVEQAHEQRYMLVQTGIQQIPVQQPENCRRCELASKTPAQVFPAHLLDAKAQQDGDEGRGRAVARYVGDVEQGFVARDRLVVDGIAAEIERGHHLVVEVEAADVLWRNRHHVDLHVAPGLLVLLEDLDALFQLVVDLLQLLADAAVLLDQTRASQRGVDGVLQDGSVG